MNSINVDRNDLPKLAETKKLYEEQLPYFETTIQRISREMRRLLEQNGFTPTIKYRIKRFDAYYDKLCKSNLSNHRGKGKFVGDLLGMRIICPFLEDIETIERLIQSEFEVIETEQKATQHSFREFGYDAVHLLVKLPYSIYETPLPGVRDVCEVQLRTILQDAWAEVEHELVYKSDVPLLKASIQRKLASLNATLTLSDLIFQEIRDYQKEIRHYGDIRREVFAEQLDLHSQFDRSLTPPIRPKPIPSTLTSRLEKTMLRALEAHSGQNLETAIELYGLILGMKLERPIRSLVYNHRGMAYFSLGDNQRALRDFSQAVHFDDTSDRGFANRGLCYRIKKQYERALADYENALVRDPNRLENYLGRARTFCDMERYEEAIRDCKKVLELRPEDDAAKGLLDAIKSRFQTL